MTETENVATYARIRPYNPAINEDKRLTARAVDGCKILNQNGDRQDTYNFTKVFDMKNSSNDVFEQAMKPLLEFKILQGINSIFIVYGQSGSGKSFTLIGEPGHLGVLPMSLRYLLDQDDVSGIKVASIEAYGLKAAKIGFYDLVSQLAIKKDLAKSKGKKSKKGKKKAKAFDPFASKPNSRLTVDNTQFMDITKDNCLTVITELQEVSHMAPTLKNPHSSRGHTVYFCRIIMKSIQDVYFIAVDLAGSEGQTALGTQDEFVNGLQLAMSKGKLHLNKTGAGIFKEMYKTRSLEAGCINNGLTQLQTIFGELIRKKISKSQGLGLRKVLSSFISLKSAYSIMFTLSASANNNKVTRATLNFAKQTQLVKVDTQKAKKKIDKDAIIRELNALIQSLKDEMKQKDQDISDLKKQVSLSPGPAASPVAQLQPVASAIGNGSGSGVAQPVALAVAHSAKLTAIFSKMDILTQQISDAEAEEAKWNVSDADIQTNNMDENELRKIFSEFDTDDGGTIDSIELQNSLKKMGKDYSIDEVNELIVEVDANGDGEIDFEEFKVMVGQTWFRDAFQSKLVNKMEKFMTNTMHVNPFADGDFDLDFDDNKDGDDDNDFDPFTQKLLDDIKYEYEEKLNKLNYDNTTYIQQINDLKNKVIKYEKAHDTTQYKISKLGDNYDPDPDVISVDYKSSKMNDNYEPDPDVITVDFKQASLNQNYDAPQSNVDVDVDVDDVKYNVNDIDFKNAEEHGAQELDVYVGIKIQHTLQDKTATANAGSCGCFASWINKLKAAKNKSSKNNKSNKSNDDNDNDNDDDNDDKSDMVLLNST